jgi:hypothetical protein
MQRKLFGTINVDLDATTDLIFCIRHILEIKLEYNEAVHQVIVNFKKVYFSVRRE